MNQSLFLHIVERLEGFLGKLPAGIQKPILHEVTPLKELFLQQRPPRFVLTGSSKLPAHEVVARVFGFATPDAMRDVLVEVYRWQIVDADGRGEIALLDARGADARALATVRDELTRLPGDIFFFIDDASFAAARRESEISELSSLIDWNDSHPIRAKVVGLMRQNAVRADTSEHDVTDAEQVLLSAFATSNLSPRVLRISRWSESTAPEHAKQLMSLLAQELSNEARVEMIRISGDREAQAKIAQVLVKSTTAIATAIGTQPIPLADLPILTTLKLVMVSGIMYVSGRERSMRAATEFLGALGANVGAGMLLREGTRAVLKFFPGWGNVVCGMVAGAGTYAIGKAATVYFIEGLSLKDARRIYLTSRKKRRSPSLKESATATSFNGAEHRE